MNTSQKHPADGGQIKLEVVTGKLPDLKRQLTGRSQQSLVAFLVMVAVAKLAATAKVLLFPGNIDLETKLMFPVQIAEGEVSVNGYFAYTDAKGNDIRIVTTGQDQGKLIQNMEEIAQNFVGVQNVRTAQQTKRLHLTGQPSRHTYVSVNGGPWSFLGNLVISDVNTENGKAFGFKINSRGQAYEVMQYNLADGALKMHDITAWQIVARTSLADESIAAIYRAKMNENDISLVPVFFTNGTARILILDADGGVSWDNPTQQAIMSGLYTDNGFGAVTVGYSPDNAGQPVVGLLPPKHLAEMPAAEMYAQATKPPQAQQPSA
ncbi:hypothetical protein EXS71_02400 [Candidatus Uhrbacteria bacterium]|nr:hypothetical protein [Candidatus Uhrbacteria bacterium]